MQTEKTVDGGHVNDNKKYAESGSSQVIKIVKTLNKLNLDENNRINRGSAIIQAIQILNKVIDKTKIHRFFNQS